MNYKLTQVCLVVIIALTQDTVENPLESITTCGIFITSIKKTSVLSRNVLQNAIHMIYFHNPRLQTLIIQTTETNHSILPYIFKSMRDDCYLHIHFNFELGIFSTYLLMLEVIDRVIKSTKTDFGTSTARETRGMR